MQEIGGSAFSSDKKRRAREQFDSSRPILLCSYIKKGGSVPLWWDVQDERYHYTASAVTDCVIRDSVNLYELYAQEVRSSCSLLHEKALLHPRISKRLACAMSLFN